MNISGQHLEKRDAISFVVVVIVVVVAVVVVVVVVTFLHKRAVFVATASL